MSDSGFRNEIRSGYRTGKLDPGLGAIYMAAGAVREADALYRAALERTLRTSPPDHLLRGQLYHALGHVAWIRGQLGRAEASLRAAWKIRVAVLGKDHPETAQVANDLGALYHENGRRPAARALYEHTLEILETNPRERFPRLGGCLNNLALLKTQEGELEQAASFLRKYLDHLFESRGRQDPEAARSLSRLARIERHLGRGDAARQLHQDAVALCRGSLGPRHPELAAALVGLAGHHLAVGEVEEATRTLRQALRIERRSLGPGHPRVAATLCELAAARAEAGTPGEAWRILGEAMEVDERWPRRIAAQSLRRWLRTTGLRERLERILDLTRRHWAADPRAVTRAFDLLRRYRILVRNLDRLTDPSLPGEAKHCALRLLRLQCDHLWLTGPGCGDLARHRRLLAFSLEQLRRLRHELGQRGTDSTLRKAGGDPSLKLLRPGEARVELVRVRTGELAELPDPSLTIYLAFVLARGREVRMIELGEGRALDEAVDLFHRGAHTEPLRDRLLEPLRSYLDDAGSLILTLEGPLVWVPLERLRLGDGRALGERYEVVYLENGDPLP